MAPQKFKLLLKYLIGITILCFIGASVDLGLITKQLRALSIQNILLVCAAALALLISQALRLHGLIFPYVAHFTTTLRLSFVSIFFSNFLPGGMGGDIYKVAFLRQTKASTTNALIFIAIDRLIALFYFVAAAAILLLIRPAYRTLFPFTASFSHGKFLAATALLACAAFLGLFFFKDRVKSFAREAKSTVTSLSGTQLSLFALFSFLTFIVRIGKTYLIIWLFVPDFHWEYVILLLFVIHVVAMIPVSVGSLGILEGSLIMALSLLGIPMESGASIAVVYRMTILFLSCCGLVWWLVCKKDVRHAPLFNSISKSR